MMSLELFQIYHLKEMSLSVELFLSCSILQCTFYAISTSYQRKAGFVILNAQVYYVGTLFIILAFFLILNEDLLVTNLFTSNNFIINDYFSFASKSIICLISILFLFTINVSFRDEPIQNNFEYVILVIISILGLLLLCSANDLITAYLAIELHSIAFYIMSAFKRNSSYSIESGLKYFIIGALSSALFLFGSTVIYGCTGTLNFDDLQVFLSLLSVSDTLSFYQDLNISHLFTQSEGLLATCELVYDKSLLDLINSSAIDHSKVAVTYSIGSANELGLIDWCYKNKYISSVFLLPIVLHFESMNTLIKADDWFNLILDCNSSWFLIPSINFSFYFTGLSLMSSDFWTNLLVLNNDEVINSLTLIKQAFSLYSNVGLSYNLTESSLLNTSLISIGFIFVCVSLFIKLAIAPFHFWSLDVYEGSPNVTTFFFAVVPKMALFILLMRLCYVSFYSIFINNFQIYFFILAALSVFVGSLGGIEQRRLKTLLAYSSISHTGYLLLSFTTGNFEGIQMMFYYLAIYMISGACFWAIYLFLRQKRGSYYNKSNKELGDLVLLNNSNPMLTFILAITLFSIAGIPPIVGFLAKIGVFLVVVKSSAYLIATLSILFSVISTFYYIRLIKILYFENVLVGKLYLPITTRKALLVSVLALMLIILCVDPTIIYLLFYKATLLTS